MKNLAVDLGNFNTKTSEEVCFVSAHTKDIQIDKNAQIIEFEGVKYCMEIGNFDKEYNKAAKDYMPNLLYAISKSTDETEINLILGLPITQLGKSEDIKNKLEEQSFCYKLNSIDKTIHIHKVAIVAEGLSSFYSFSDSDQSKDVTIIDIGGRTTNVVTIAESKVLSKDTLTYGILSLYKDICNAVNNDGGKLVEERVNIKLSWGELDEYKEKIKELKYNLMDRIKNDLKDLDIAPNIIFTGGGSAFIGEMLTEMYPNKKCKLANDPVFTNVKGNLKLANAKWR